MQSSAPIMYQQNCLRVFVIMVLLLRVFGDVEFNSLSKRLVMDLIKSTPKQNVVASEYLVRLSLCKLASVATGDAKLELMLLLGYNNDVALSKCYSTIAACIKLMRQGDLTVTNRIYLNYTNDVDPKFIANSSENDGVQVEKVGFNYPKAAIKHINNLISSMTFKRIRDIVDSNDINKSTKMIIVSGAHFKGSWEFPFDYRLTKLTKFRNIDGKTSRIPMMTKMDEFMYNQQGVCEVLTIRFASYRSSMTFVLPNTPKDLATVLQTISDQKDFVSNLAKRSRTKLMKVTIPRFKIKTFVDWTGFLQELGLYSIFNTNSSDLAGIYKTGSRNQTISLSKIKQKVFLHIDEMGVARKIPDPFMTDKPTEMPYHLPAFIADRPFYFEVTWNVDGDLYNIFAGVYYGPESDPLNF